MFHYTAYGLNISSVFPLPELMRAEAAADVTVRRGPVDRPPGVGEGPDSSFWAAEDEIRLFSEKLGAFRIQGGKEIVVDPAPGADEMTLRFVLFGSVLALLLHQRQCLVLHANTVAVQGSAIAFLGNSGQGKSTMSATLYTAGHSFVADDVTAVHLGANGPIVYPSFPHTKLCPDTVAFLGDAVEALPRLQAWSDKCLRPAARGFSLAPVPLRRIYVLTDGPQRQIEPLRPQEAFMELVRHTYPTVGQLLQLTGTTVSHFRLCEKFTQGVSICRLKRPRSLEALPALARFVAEDVTAVA